MFQEKAAIKAQSTVASVTTFVSTSPLPMVEATAPPASAPVRLKKAAMIIACRGVSTFVETTVAIALAASWNPLLYSKMIAARTTVRKMSMAGVNADYAYFNTTCRMMFPASRQRSITFSSNS